MAIQNLKIIANLEIITNLEIFMFLEIKYLEMSKYNYSVGI